MRSEYAAFTVGNGDPVVALQGRDTLVETVGDRVLVVLVAYAGWATFGEDPAALVLWVL